MAPIPRDLLRLLVVDILRILLVEGLQLPLEIMQLALPVQQAARAQTLELAVDGCILIFGYEFRERRVAS